MREKLISILGGVPVPDPEKLGDERDLVTQEFQLRLVHADLFAGANTRAEIVESAMRLLNESAAKVEADARLIARHHGSGSESEDVEFATAAARLLPRD